MLVVPGPASARGLCSRQGPVFEEIMLGLLPCHHYLEIAYFLSKGAKAYFALKPASNTLATWV